MSDFQGSMVLTSNPRRHSHIKLSAGFRN